jgi:hypothetical protein
VDRVERQPDGSLLNADPMIYEYHLAPLESPTGLVRMRYVSGTKSTDISPVGLSYLFEHMGWWQTLPPIEDLVATITTDGAYVTDIVFTDTK